MVGNERKTDLNDALGVRKGVVESFVGGIAVIFLFFAILGILGSVVIINTGEVGVLLQFGEMKDVLQPGIHLVIPYISSVKMMSVQTMKYEVHAAAASSDLQIVSSNIAVNYHIKDDKESVMYLYRQFMERHEERIIAPLVQETVKANTAKYTANDLVQRRESAKAAITISLKEKLLGYGLYVDEVSITNFDFSKDFNNAIEAKVVVEQNKQKAELELQQKQIEVLKLVAEQNATATAQVIQATADRTSAILRAEGQANATLTQAEAQAKAIDMIQSKLSTEYVQYQIANQWDGRLPVYTFGGSGLLVNLPLNGTG